MLLAPIKSCECNLHFLISIHIQMLLTDCTVWILIHQIGFLLSKTLLNHDSVQFSSVTQSCLNLYDPMNCSTSPPWPVNLGWPHMAWLSFIELDKAVIHAIRLACCLWLWFQSVCPLMPSLTAYHLTWTWTSPDGQHRNENDYILCSQRWRSSIQSAKTRSGADCGSDHELLIDNH